MLFFQASFQGIPQAGKVFFRIVNMGRYADGIPPERYVDLLPCQLGLQGIRI